MVVGLTPVAFILWLGFKFFLDGIMPCLCCSFLRFCASNFSRIVCGLFATLVLLMLREMMRLMYFKLFVPDTAFSYDFLNAVGSLVCYRISSLDVSGLYFRLLNFFNLRWNRLRFVFATLVLMSSSIWKYSSFAVTFFKSVPVSLMSCLVWAIVLSQ